MLALQFSAFPVLATPRLILREHTKADASALFATRTDDEVMRYIDRERPTTLQDSEEAIANMATNYIANKNLVWVISLKDAPDTMIGTVGYFNLFLNNHRAEIGYMLLPAYWRQGIISEALKEAIHFGFNEMKLHSIAANINPGNNASRQLLVNHGFVKEAYFKEDFYFKGRFLDSEIYSLLAAE